jgi:uncharacterized membrane protein (UPF0127 family)
MAAAALQAAKMGLVAGPTPALQRTPAGDAALIADPNPPPHRGRRSGAVRALLVGLALAAAVGGAACGREAPAFGSGTLSIRTRTGLVELRVEVADTDAARQRGLMGRRSLATDAGMAFVFDHPTEGGFWMKDTLIPLDIAFWAPGGRIVAVLRMSPCRADPCPLYSPGLAYVGAVEANRGFFADHAVRVGDVVRLVRTAGTPDFVAGQPLGPPGRFGSRRPVRGGGGGMTGSLPMAGSTPERSSRTVM